MAFRSLAQLRGTMPTKHSFRIRIDTRKLGLIPPPDMLEKLGWKARDQIDIGLGDGPDDGLILMSRMPGNAPKRQGWCLTVTGGGARSMGIKISKHILPLPGMPDLMKDQTTHAEIKNGAIIIVLPWGPKAEKYGGIPLSPKSGSLKTNAPGASVREDGRAMPAGSSMSEPVNAASAGRDVGPAPFREADGSNPVVESAAVDRSDNISAQAAPEVEATPAIADPTPADGAPASETGAPSAKAQVVEVSEPAAGTEDAAPQRAGDHASEPVASPPDFEVERQTLTVVTTPAGKSTVEGMSLNEIEWRKKDPTTWPKALFDRFVAAAAHWAPHAELQQMAGLTRIGVDEVLAKLRDDIAQKRKEAGKTVGFKAGALPAVPTPKKALSPLPPIPRGIVEDRRPREPIPTPPAMDERPSEPIISSARLAFVRDEIAPVLMRTKHRVTARVDRGIFLLDGNPTPIEEIVKITNKVLVADGEPPIRMEEVAA